MNEITFNYINPSVSGLDIQQLKQSEYYKEQYNSLLKENAGSLTQVYGNEASSIFLVAKQNLMPNQIQAEILNNFKESILSIEQKINPERLKFTITKAADDEICINRKATREGRIKIIINDDGVIAFSYMSGTANSGSNILQFYNESDLDFEKLAYDFFKY